MSADFDFLQTSGAHRAPLQQGSSAARGHAIIEIMKEREQGPGPHSLRALVLLLVLAAGAVKLNGQGGEAFKEFQSAKYHFTVQYPASWFPLAGTTDILDITNFERTPRVPGIALRVGGAEITVTQAPSDVHTAEQWVLRDLPDASWVSKDFAAEQVDLPVSDPAAGGCQRIKRVTWRDELAPEAYLVETNYYCSTGAQLYKIALSNWDGDRDQSKLRLIATEVAQSLRSQ